MTSGRWFGAAEGGSFALFRKAAYHALPQGGGSQEKICRMPEYKLLAPIFEVWYPAPLFVQSGWLNKGAP